jgi:hypothetical protein
MRGSIAQPWSKILSRTRRRRRNSGDLAFGRAKVRRTGPHGEGDEPTPVMNGREKSDPAVVAAESTNEAGREGADGAKGRDQGKCGLASTLRIHTLRASLSDVPAGSSLHLAM